MKTAANKKLGLFPYEMGRYRYVRIGAMANVGGCCDNFVTRYFIQKICVFCPK